jgi:uncharacterized protein (TIGR03437 family)
MRTGAPVDGGITCTACHRTFAPVNSDPRGRVTIVAGPYTPGVTQTIKITIFHPDQKRWGFQLTARSAGNPAQGQGTFTANTNIRVRCGTSGADAPCNGALEFASHRSAVVTDTGLGFTYSVDWTPPANSVGDIILYAAGNAADGNGTNANDRIYNTSAIISPATCDLSVLPSLSAAVSSASYVGPIAPNTLISLFGSGFQPEGLTRALYDADLGSKAVPNQLSCAAVEINRVRAPMYYTSSGQMNVVVPSGVTPGPAEVRVVLNPANRPVFSSPITVTAASAAPGLFTLDGKRAVAQFAGTANLVGDPATLTGAAAAKPGDLVTLWATGLGDTNPKLDAAAIAQAAAPTVNTVTVTLNGTALVPANVMYAGLAPGLVAGAYQINIKIPAGVAAGDTAIKLAVNGNSSADGVTLRLAAQ